MFMGPTPVVTVCARRPFTGIAFCARVAQAMPGDRLEYHRGFPVLDIFPMFARLPDQKRAELARLGSRAFRAAEQGLLHLVQERTGPAPFACIAVFRPMPKAAAVSLSARPDERCIGFVDSITDLTRQAMARATTRPAAISERTGRPDTRGGCGLLACEAVGLVKASNQPGSDAPMRDAGFTVAAGPQARRKVWQNSTLQGGKRDEQGQSIGRTISKSTLRAMIDSALGLIPEDMSEAARTKRLLRRLAVSWPRNDPGAALPVLRGCATRAGPLPDREDHPPAAAPLCRGAEALRNGPALAAFHPPCLLPRRYLRRDRPVMP
jgi:hypothetical protein